MAWNLVVTVGWVIYFLAIIFFMGALICFVYRIEQGMDQFLSEGQAPDRTQTLVTTYQGIWYAAAFFVITLVALIASLVAELSSWFYVLFSIVFPLQGFFNALVYFRRRYLNDRDMCTKSGYEGETSRSSSLCRVLDLTVPSSITFKIKRLKQANTNEQQDQPPQGVRIPINALGLRIPSDAKIVAV